MWAQCTRVKEGDIMLPRHCKSRPKQDDNNCTRKIFHRQLNVIFTMFKTIIICDVCNFLLCILLTYIQVFWVSDKLCSNTDTSCETCLNCSLPPTDTIFSYLNFVYFQREQNALSKNKQIRWSKHGHHYRIHLLWISNVGSSGGPTPTGQQPTIPLVTSNSL